jgi:nucleotide-binding universal stress UspA family protein
MNKNERILVPLDGSECAENVLPRVEELASDGKAGICLLRVVSARTFPGVDPIEAEVRVVREAKEYLRPSRSFWCGATDRSKSLREKMYGET